MRMPPRLVPLIEYGVIDRVVRPLMSGKEAQVYLVETQERLYAAKVYKKATERTFHNRAEYTEGRMVRNSRDQRAMGKRTRHGRARDEATWNAAEAEIIYKLDAAGVRVPKPLAFVEGVLVMECIEGPDGGPAPRLAECTLEPEHAEAVFEQLIREVVKMLCVGVVHGDLSVFNVLIEENGPVIIDFPQAVDAAQNRNAKKILLRDVSNLTSHFKRNVPAHDLRFGHEMWDLYERGELKPDSPMTGQFKLPKHEVDAERLIQHMREVEDDEVKARRPKPTTDERFEAPPGRIRERRPPKSRPPGQLQGTKATNPVVAPQVVVRGRPSLTPTPAAPIAPTRMSAPAVHSAPAPQPSSPSSAPRPSSSRNSGPARSTAPQRTSPPAKGAAAQGDGDAPRRRRRHRRSRSGAGGGVAGSTGSHS